MPAPCVLIPLPRCDYDPSEAALAWRQLRRAGYRVCFATPDGQPAEPDPQMVSGEGLDPWGRLPGLCRLKLLGLLLRARRGAREACAEMLGDPDYRQPLRHERLRVEDFAGLVLPGGHWARGMREYLESEALQRFVAAFFAADKPVAAVCHGVLLAARSRSADGRSVLHGRKTTGLTWKMEKTAWDLTRFYGRWWDGDYYRTYAEAPGEPAGYMSVQGEVGRALASPDDFLDVPQGAPDFWRKTSGLHRDTPTDSRPAWVVRDGNYVSGRWPGDMHELMRRFIELLPRQVG
ncbi:MULTISPECIES: type 1 glutamine amidotransferase domain-containing protein [unclassified Pseudomonas]|uniref:type 1 glutamine amidotransferase domain-containing protein n=1 Tax=unclassified Pseudomonas TaxID=196821 RepID=UPI002447B71D|nr:MULTISPECIES: type 1 glutamine amidotransferase domain-containing protein [unclassified Pseudomonas]MDH0895890.1 DJ-1/PfpI family protein [Pseudomonas sp. GD03875]MDH1065301.1 DJ-1/PfpI family protein [Pseudomonas sp. GD03985]